MHSTDLLLCNILDLIKLCVLHTNTEKIERKSGPKVYPWNPLGVVEGVLLGV